MIKIKPTAKNIISILAICNLLTKKEREVYLRLMPLIKEKYYRKTMHNDTYWLLFDEIIKSLPKELQESIIDDMENKIVLKEIMTVKPLFAKFLNEIILEIKVVKQKTIELLLQLHKVKEDKALQLKELLSKFSAILHLQKEHTELNTSQLQISTYSKLLSLHP